MVIPTIGRELIRADAGGYANPRVNQRGQRDAGSGEMNRKCHMAVTAVMRVTATMATVALCGLQAAAAQDADEIAVDVGECIEIEAPVERLACFAAQVEQALTEAEAADDGQEQAEVAAPDEPAIEAAPARQTETERLAPAAAAPTTAPAAAPVADAGEGQEREAEAIAAATEEAQADEEDLNWFERRRARRAARAAEREAAEQAERAAAAENEILATIADLRERQPNAWLITLDNGQMWDQVRPQWYPLTPGDEVRLYPTNWGSSYRLTRIDRGGYIQVQQVR